ncbi:hypothetical protein [Cryobacterium sp. Y11]|uniref:hypothetical protein n=1 Tax=Cryobacterium sp. Y11 TaxID=2045016 RepID=UPI000CE44428|nr:hypothetical protein [Cryobacterium sp. Y11]
MTIYDDYEFIANLKGRKGDQGDPGLAGPVAVANDVAFASAVSGVSATNTAVTALAAKAVLAQSLSDRGVASAAFESATTSSGTPRNLSGVAMSGIPNAQLRGVTTLGFSPNTVRYHPFEVDASLTVMRAKFEVTTSPDIACYMTVGIYSVDAFWQPMELIQQLTVAVTGVGVADAGFAMPTELPKGRYLLAVSAERAMTLRGYFGGPSFANSVPSAAISEFFEVSTPYTVDLPEPAVHWTIASTGVNGAVHGVLLDWAVNNPALDSLFMLPNRQVVKGANVVLYNQGWDLFWANWAWETDIKWQIDYAKSAGANTIRVIGDVMAITRYAIMTITEYRARWRQLIDYCASLDMYVYACGGGIPDANYDITAVTQVLVELGKEINGDERVIGLDIMQESYAFAITNMETLVPSIRAVCDRKLTFSIPTGAPWDDNSVAARNQFRPWVDFYDFHVYYDVSVNDIQDYWNRANESKPFLIGEFGLGAAAGEPAQLARFTAVRNAVALVREDGRHIAGALVWAIRDQDPDPSQYYGLWTVDKVPRQYLIDAFKAFPDHR